MAMYCLVKRDVNDGAYNLPSLLVPSSRCLMFSFTFCFGQTDLSPLVHQVEDFVLHFKTAQDAEHLWAKQSFAMWIHLKCKMLSKRSKKPNVIVLGSGINVWTNRTKSIHKSWPMSTSHPFMACVCFAHNNPIFKVCEMEESVLQKSNCINSSHCRHLHMTDKQFSWSAQENGGTAPPFHYVFDNKSFLLVVWQLQSQTQTNFFLIPSMCPGQNRHCGESREAHMEVWQMRKSQILWHVWLWHVWLLLWFQPIGVWLVWEWKQGQEGKCACRMNNEVESSWWLRCLEMWRVGGKERGRGNTKRVKGDVDESWKTVVTNTSASVSADEHQRPTTGALRFLSGTICHR